MSARSRVQRRRPSQQPDVTRLLHRLANTCKHPARLVELYYWSREPELMEIMRQIVAMPDEARSTLHAFFRLAESDPNSIGVSVNINGDVTLSSSAVEGLLTVIETSAKGNPTQPLH